MYFLPPLSHSRARSTRRYLASEHEATTICLLLGLAVSRSGSRDPLLARAFQLHVPGRHPQDFPDLEIRPAVQAASMISLGLLYRETNHRLMAEVGGGGKGGAAVFVFVFGIWPYCH